MDWGTVLSLAGLFAVGLGYLTRQVHRLDDSMTKQMGQLDDRLTMRMDRLEAKIDRLTDRYITHLEQHPR